MQSKVVNQFAKTPKVQEPKVQDPKVVQQVRLVKMTYELAVDLFNK